MTATYCFYGTLLPHVVTHLAGIATIIAVVIGQNITKLQGRKGQIFYMMELSTVTKGFPVTEELM